MNKRTIAKWKKRGIFDEMIRKHQAYRGNPVREAWKSRFAGEERIKDLYLQLQALHPTNIALRYCTLDGNNHININSIFYEEQHPELLNSIRNELERYVAGETNEPPHSGRLYLCHVLEDEIKFLSKMRVLTQKEVEIRDGNRYLPQSTE